MNYLLINSSPRGGESNSGLILSEFKKGLLRGGVDENLIDSLVLRPSLREQTWKSYVESADIIVICFPLYADSVPGILKKFIEDIGRGGFKGKKLGWISQCGFPDSVHLDLVERYLIKTSGRLGVENAGIVKKAGVEGIRIMPPSMTSKLFENLHAFGEDLAVRGHFDNRRISKLAEPRNYSSAALLGLRILSFTGLTNFYWNKNLKDNGAYKKRFARPYQP